MYVLNHCTKLTEVTDEWVHRIAYENAWDSIRPNSIKLKCQELGFFSSYYMDYVSDEEHPVEQLRAKIPRVEAIRETNSLPFEYMTRFCCAFLELTSIELPKSEVLLNNKLVADLTVALMSLPTLRHLMIRGGFNARQLRTLIVKLPNLRELEIGMGDDEEADIGIDLDYKTMVSVADMPQLRSLSMSADYALKYIKCFTVARQQQGKFPKLESLGIYCYSTECTEEQYDTMFTTIQKAWPDWSVYDAS